MNKIKLIQEKKLNALKLKLSDFDLAVPGTLRSIYSKCGKPNCICQKNPKGRHGPYWLWDRKVNGKLSSKMLPSQMVSQIKSWIENRRRLEEALVEILIISQEVAALQVENSRKSDDKNA